MTFRRGGLRRGKKAMRYLRVLALSLTMVVGSACTQMAAAWNWTVPSGYVSIRHFFVAIPGDPV